ncbi:MAG: TOTE conflict system archaeo-eukaryotic primase domain-containing protein [Chitinophagales bacterium]
MNEAGEREKEIERLLAECARLKEENAQLRALLGRPSESSSPVTRVVLAAESGTVTNDSPAEYKIALFRSLFCGRTDVYAVRWARRDGKSGYSPACRNEWVPGVCRKPCAKCENHDYLPVTDQVIRDHLAGKKTIGVYPLLSDDACWFLAADFDKAAWREDAGAFLSVCDELNVPAALERSRSGNGAHVWIFFDHPLPASLARNLGAVILTQTTDRRYQVGLDSYDRFFPNQDTLPKGGFGNLIALPLQRGPRHEGNTVFVDRDFRPYRDQWAFLSQVRRMRLDEVESIVRAAARAGRIVGVRISLTQDDGDDPWVRPSSGERGEEPIEGPKPETVRLVQANLVYLPKEGLPPALLNRLVRLAAFQNPEFYQAQKMRMSTFGKPRVISCAEEFAHHIGLPRGCLEEIVSLLRSHGIRPEVADERFAGVPFEASFQGRLTPRQAEAAHALLEYDTGILSATTGFGKTVVAAWLIAARKVNTLVLVHRRQLADQWRERLAVFLELPTESIGQIGGGKTKPTGLLDVGVIQSLSRKGLVRDVVADYGQVIVDECHHLSAFSFEQVLRQARARYVVGLTATPVRKDGHHPIIMMQCGPIRFRTDARKEAEARPFRHLVIPRQTKFRLLPDRADPRIQEIYALLAADEERNDLIVSDVLQGVREGRFPLILTERTQHLQELAQRLQGSVRHVVLLCGGMSQKRRQAIAQQLAAIPEGEERVIVATGRYAGEGFDDARLDTLYLAMPISWRGTLQQYAGRLHRTHEGKRVVKVYDYVDVQVPVLARMHEKRLRGYRAMGYRMVTEGGP